MQYLHFLAVAFHIRHSLDLKSTELKVHPALAGDHCIVKHKVVVHCTGIPGVLVQVGTDQEFEHEVVRMMAIRAREKIKLFMSHSKMKTNTSEKMLLHCFSRTFSCFAVKLRSKSYYHFYDSFKQM